MYNYDSDEYRVTGDAPALAVLDATPGRRVASPNGVSTVGLKLPVRLAKVELTDAYAGYWATVRLNPRRRVLDAIKSDDLLASCRGYAQLIVAWNFTDEDGNALEPTGENFYDLPDDMMGQLVKGYFAHFNAATEVPKP